MQGHYNMTDKELTYLEHQLIEYWCNKDKRSHEVTHQDFTDIICLKTLYNWVERELLNESKE